MATAKRTTRRKAPKKCPDCKGAGTETTSVYVGSGRRRRETGDQQIATCMACFGTGLDPLES